MSAFDECDRLQNILRDKKIKDFVAANLKDSLINIGFSKEFVNDLIKTLDNLEEYPKLQEKYSYELMTVYSDGFFKKIVPDYFQTHVVPEIPSSKKVLDIGCGTGILAERLSRLEKFDKIIGVELKSYIEWETFVNKKIFFTVANKEGAFNLIEEEKPDSIIMTWTLHHMPFKDQEEYIKKLYEVMSYGSKLIILEDTYSEKLLPVHGKDKKISFMEFNVEDRRNIMSIYDWFANRVLAQRKSVPITYTYRTMEGWIDLFEKTGFFTNYKKYIGFPKRRDINTPQGVLVFEKKIKEKGLARTQKDLQSKSGSEFNHILAFKKVFSNKKLSDYLKENFEQSLPTIGFSKSFVRDFIRLLDNIEDYREFRDKYEYEIQKIHSEVFFQHIVPDLFEKYVVPEVPKSNRIIDIGCGTGFLPDLLSKHKKAKEIIGLDIQIYPEWKKFIAKNVRFVLINHDGLYDYIKDNRPDTVIITWTLQHLTQKQQKDYISHIWSVLKKGSRIIVMDDCYSEKLKPLNGREIYSGFKLFKRKDRDNIMYVYDWVANKILARRDHATVQGSPYTSLEEREQFFKRLGFKTVKKVFIGFTKKRDTNTPLSLIVVEKYTGK